MKKSFANLNGPILATVIKERTPALAIAAIRNAESHGTDVLDLHVSFLEKEYQTVEHIRSIINCTKKPMLGLNYNANVNGIYESSEEDRIALLELAADAGIAAVDMQGYSFDLPSRDKHTGSKNYSFSLPNAKEIVTDPAIIQKQMAFINRMHAKGVEVLISTHTGVPMNCDQIVDLAKFLEERDPDIIKIVTPCENDEQVAEAFKTMITLRKEIKKAKIHFHCSGEAGRITRLVNPLLGAYMAFCVDHYGPGHEPTQLHLETMSRAMGEIKRLL